MFFSTPQISLLASCLHTALVMAMVGLSIGQPLMSRLARMPIYYGKRSLTDSPSLLSRHLGNALTKTNYVTDNVRKIHYDIPRKSVLNLLSRSGNIFSPQPEEISLQNKLNLKKIVSDVLSYAEAYENMYQDNEPKDFVSPVNIDVNEPPKIFYTHSPEEEAPLPNASIRNFLQNIRGKITENEERDSKLKHRLPERLRYILQNSLDNSKGIKSDDVSDRETSERVKNEHLNREIVNSLVGQFEEVRSMENLLGNIEKMILELFEDVLNTSDMLAPAELTDPAPFENDVKRGYSGTLARMPQFFGKRSSPMKKLAMEKHFKL